MADFSITITVPDDKVADIVAAYNDRFPQTDQNGDPVVMDAAAVRALIKDKTMASMKTVYQSYKRDQAASAATDDPGIT